MASVQPISDRPAAIAEQVRRTVLEVEPRQRIQRMQTMDEIMASTTADSRFVAWLSEDLPRWP